MTSTLPPRDAGAGTDAKVGQLVESLLKRTAAGAVSWFPWHDRGVFVATFDNKTGVLVARGPRERHNLDEGSLAGAGQQWTDLILLNADGLEVARYSADADWSPFSAMQLPDATAARLRDLFPLASRSALRPDEVLDGMLAQLAG